MLHIPAEEHGMNVLSYKNHLHCLIHIITQKKRHLAENVLRFLPPVKICSYLVYFYYIVSVGNKTEITATLMLKTRY